MLVAARIHGAVGGAGARRLSSGLLTARDVYRQRRYFLASNYRTHTSSMPLIFLLH